MLHCRDCISQVMSSAWCSPNIVLAALPKEFNLYQTNYLFFSGFSQSFKCRLANSKRAIVCLSPNSGFRQAALTIRARLLECCEDMGVCHSEQSIQSATGGLKSTQHTIKFTQDTIKFRQDTSQRYLKQTGWTWFGMPQWRIWILF